MLACALWSAPFVLLALAWGVGHALIARLPEPPSA